MRSQGQFPRRVILVSVLLVAGGLIAAESRADETSPLGSFDGVTTGFIENRGQVDEAAQYYAPGSRATMYFTAEAVVFDLREEVEHDDAGPAHDGRDPFVDQPASEPQARRGCAVWFRFEGANASPTIEPRGELVTRYNYFLGKDPNRWQTNVPAYAEIVYHDLWPGIDLLFRNEGGRITYDVILSPGADPERIRFRYEGADRVTAREDGSLRVETPVGSFTDLRPLTGSEVGAFLLGESGRQPGADSPTHGRDNPEALLWSTFLGGSDSDDAHALALDPSGNPVLTGWTESSNFPTTPGAYDESHNGGYDVFVTKLDASGSALHWSTFLGGSDSDHGRALTLDSSGNPVVTGSTRSSGFPTTPGAYDESHNGGSDVFVTKLDASGSALLWSTFLGGSRGNVGSGLALDPSGNPVVTGTGGFDFPTTPGAYDESFNGEEDAFVAKLDASGSTLLWSTFLGGSNEDNTHALALDPSGNPVLTGWTESSNFPTTPDAYDESHNGDFDVFVAKLDASGSALLWSTFLGGDDTDIGLCLALDPSMNPVVTGTGGFHFPTTPGAYDESFNGGGDVFITKLDASGSTLLWSTFLGGSSPDQGHGLALDSSGNPVLTGWTRSSNFPTTPEAYDQSYNGGVQDVFVAKLDPTGSALLWSTFLGGSGTDSGDDLALDPSDNPVVTGSTGSPDFPTTPGAYDESHNGSYDVFVAKLSIMPGPPLANFVGVPPSGYMPLSVQFTDLSTGQPTSWSWDFGDGGTSTARNPQYEYTASGDYDVTLTVSNAYGSDSETKLEYIHVAEPEPNALALSDIPVTGTVSGDYTATHASDDAYEVITEVSSQTHPRKWYSVLEHRWDFNVVPAPAITFRVEAYRPDNTDGDDFAFEYSTDGAGFTHLLTVNSPTEQTYSAALPGGISGTLYIRVVDTDHTQRHQSLDAIYIDYLVIEFSSTPAPPVADFVGVPPSGYVPLSVQFTDLSTGQPTSWSWDFGDGGTSTAQNPVHEYPVPSDYTVSLTATNAYGTDTEVKVDYITAVPVTEGTMHVHDMVVTRKIAGPNHSGLCTVWIYDEGNQPVAGALVTVEATGPVGGTFSGSTGDDGTVEFETGKIKDPVGEWCFEVLDVTHDNYTYDPLANNVTMACESGGGGDQVGPGAQELSFGRRSQAVVAGMGLRTIIFTLAAPAQVRLDIFDVAGKKVATLVDGWRSAGSHAAPLDPAALSSGVYFCRLKTGERCETRRLTLIH